jgi:hypothetical protein
VGRLQQSDVPLPIFHIISNELHSQHFRLTIYVSEIVQISQVTCETDPAIFPKHSHGQNEQPFIFLIIF